MKFDIKKHMSIKVIAMDLDGTLTQHKQPLTEENRAILAHLSKKYKLLMAGAGQVERIWNQLGRMPIDIIGNYGLQYGEYDAEKGEMKLLRDLCFDCDREKMEEKITYCRKKYGFESYRGDNTEFHPSGCVTFPILGTKALIVDKLAFDPDRSKRRAIYEKIKEIFSEYTVFIGGSSSFDMAPMPYNKYYALDLYCREKRLSHENVVFIGDDYGYGGNDEAVFLSDFPFICIDDYRDFPRATAQFL